MERLSYFSRCPPSKRPNYFLYGLKSPFRPLWTNIVRDWILECEPSTNIVTPVRFDVLRRRRPFSIELLRENLQSLIPIRVTCRGKKGVVDDSTWIYLPTKNDLKQQKNPIVESRHSDQARIEERKMKKGKQSFHKGQTMINLFEERAKNTELSIIHDCDRKLLGAVTYGAFQYSRACCVGKGFIAAGGLIKLLESQTLEKNNKQKSRLVLIRTAASQYYRWASLEF